MPRSLALGCLLTCIALTAAAAPTDAALERPAADGEEPQVILPAPGSSAEEMDAPRVAPLVPWRPSNAQQEPRIEPSTRGSQGELEVSRSAAPTRGRQAEDQEQPRIAPPRPAPTTPLTPHIALAVVLRARGGFGFDLCLYPLERLKVGGELSSVLWVSEAGLYARYAIVHWGLDDVDLGVRLQGLSVLLGPSHEQVALELGWEERFGSNLFGIDLELGARRDGVWFPRDPAAITGGLRLGHFW